MELGITGREGLGLCADGKVLFFGQGHCHMSTSMLCFTVFIELYPIDVLFSLHITYIYTNVHIKFYQATQKETKPDIKRCFWARNSEN